MRKVHCQHVAKIHVVGTLFESPSFWPVVQNHLFYPSLGADDTKRHKSHFNNLFLKKTMFSADQTHAHLLENKFLMFLDICMHVMTIA